MHKVTVVWGLEALVYLCGLSYVPKASKVKKGEVGLKRRICRAQVKYRIYMLGTVHVSIQFFFTEMVISSSQTCYKYFPSGTYLYPPARPDPWLLHFFGVIFAFLSLVNMGNFDNTPGQNDMWTRRIR